MGCFAVISPLHAQTATQVWAKRYNGPANANDSASSLALDSSGNAAVTGYSVNASGNPDIYTAKYEAANGALLWEKRYVLGGHYNAYRIAVDEPGNVVVAGNSYTVKYAALDGALLWAYTAAANSVVIDGAGSPNASAFSATTTTVLVDTPTTLKERDNLLLATHPARYPRVKVTAAP